MCEQTMQSYSQTHAVMQYFPKGSTSNQSAVDVSDDIVVVNLV